MCVRACVRACARARVCTLHISKYQITYRRKELTESKPGSTVLSLMVKWNGTGAAYNWCSMLSSMEMHILGIGTMKMLILHAGPGSSG